MVAKFSGVEFGILVGGSSIGDFHCMKFVEFHFLTYSSIFIFEWGIQEKLNKISRNF